MHKILLTFATVGKCLQVQWDEGRWNYMIDKNYKEEQNFPKTKPLIKLSNQEFYKHCSSIGLGD